MVRVTRGKVLDVAVDLRKNSPTYGKWTSVILSARNRRQFFLPKGFGHGFVVLSKTAIFQYKCDDFYCKEAEGGIAWNDPKLNIDWGIPKDDIILSEKDKHHESFEEFDKHNLFSKIPVSIVTGDDYRETVDRVFAYPVVDILIKPFNERDIKRIVEKTIYRG